MTFTSIECPRHGISSPRTFACVHLVDGERLGFCIPPNATEAWPDATCEACASEEWTDAIAAERVRMLCKRCWEDAFGRNTRIEPHPDPRRWLHDAQHRAADRQERWRERFRIETYPHYQMELEDPRPWIGFGDSPTRIHVRGDAIVLGSWSMRGESWLWGWGNESCDVGLTSAPIAVKRFGEANGLAPLWRLECAASEEDAFALALGALDVMRGLEAVYRVPDDAISVFLGIANTCRVS